MVFQIKMVSSKLDDQILKIGDEQNKVIHFLILNFNYFISNYYLYSNNNEIKFI